MDTTQKHIYIHTVAPFDSCLEGALHD